MRRLHGSLASPHCGTPPLDRPWQRAYLPCREDHSDPENRTMAQNTSQPLSLGARKLQAQADAVLDQMFGYFTREEAPREAEARRAA